VSGTLPIGRQFAGISLLDAVLPDDPDPAFLQGAKAHQVGGA